MPRLACEKLSKSFGGVIALDDVTIGFPTHGIAAIVGPNGAGKTTLLNVMTGFLRADSGSVKLESRDISRMEAHRVSRLGIARTFQELRLIRHVSLLENTMLAGPNQSGEHLHRAVIGFGTSGQERLNHERGLHALETVGLADRADDLAGALSYGQQKLLTLAVCLATQASILLLDEPVTGVHPEMVRSIVQLMKELRSLGKLVIFIEHDIATVRSVADVVIVMDHARVIAQGPPEVILERPEVMEAYIA